MIKTGAFFMFTFAVVALLATFAQINPIWLFGPYTPDSITAGSQPDFYMGFLEGALRIMPNWETNLWGHTIPWNVLIPGARAARTDHDRRRAVAVHRTVGDRRQEDPPPRRPAAQRAVPHRGRA